MLINYGMMPRALGECRNRGGELALGRRCRQQLADNGETELRPPLVSPFASCPITHAALPRLRRRRSLQAVSGAGDERLLRICESHYRTFTWTPGMGLRNRSKAVMRSAASPAKRSSIADGSRASSTGGITLARAARQNGVAVNASRHHIRQR